MKAKRVISMQIGTEADIVAVRQRARLLAEHLQFARQDQTRIATAVSEIARNAFSYGGGGRAEFFLDQVEGHQRLLIKIVDRGHGIADLDAVLEGRYRSKEGLGLGIAGARRLLDHFDIQTSPQGTQVELGHYLPARARQVTAEDLVTIAGALGQSRELDPLHAVREQDREILASLEDLRRRQDEVDRLGRELEDTNRGVVALYAELEARAEQLREASEIKSHFLSNMSHEFRTPLNSIIALTGLLLDGVDGGLNAEQEKQITYVRKSAHDLLELVNDLLDLAKVEAGKLEAKALPFTIQELFSGLRGALKPLRQSGNVELVFETSEWPEMYTDEGKVGQILRNLISNALKFTEQGEVRVSAHHDSRARAITFVVSDTGIGIAPEDQARIFEEFSQVSTPLQKKAKGTGLGLPLSQKLAVLLGGEIWLESEIGKGSTFYLSIPIVLPGATPLPADQPAKRILIVDDDETFRYVLRQLLGQFEGVSVAEAVDGQAALERIRADHPDLVFLDLQMPRLTGFEVLSTLRADASTCDQRVIVCTSLTLDAETSALLPEDLPILPKHVVSRDRIRGLIEETLRS